jgi:aldehyde dehydrogenase (NAD(P)+)
MDVKSDTTSLDADLRALAEHKRAWARLPVAEKIATLRVVRQRTGRVAEGWVAAAMQAKGIAANSRLAGEEWTAGPFALAAGAAAYEETLRRIDARRPILDGYKTRTLDDGRVALRVWPATLDDRFFLSGHRGEVWMQNGVTENDLEGLTARFYRTGDAEGALALILGAGNVASIPPLDLLYKLYVDGAVGMVKLNPVNEYLGEFFEEIFAPLIDDGYVRFAYGGADVGGYLTRHPLVETIHITGSETTHDAVVYGVGPDAVARKERDEPIIDIPVTSELGGVGPTIVVPGAWSPADIRYQAEHIMSQKLHNHGFNCVACQVLVLPEGWEQGDTLLEAMREVVAELDERHAYYPGAADRHEVAVSNHRDAEILTDGWAPITFCTDVDPMATDDVAFTMEFFGSVLAVTHLAGDTVGEYLDNAVGFANDTLVGNLGANVLIHPTAMRNEDQALRRAVHDLRFGSVAVNTWVGVVYAMPRAPWGAYPGNPRNHIESGSGVVHNALMLERTEKVVVRGAFAPFPRTLRHGVIHTEPLPPHFVTNQNAATLGRALTDQAVSGSRRDLARVAVAAYRP